MLFSSWLRNWKGSLERRAALSQIRRRKSLASPLAPRLFLETLEDRTLLTSVTILGSDLISAGGLSEQYGINGFLSLGVGNRTINLDPGTYSVVNGSGTYGTFTLSSQGTVSGATGALVATGNTIDFNVNQLAGITINGGDLNTTQGTPELANIYGVTGHEFQDDTIYLPTGTYTLDSDAISFNSTVADFGTFTVAQNGSGTFGVSATTGVLAATGNTIDFNVNQLAAVTIHGVTDSQGAPQAAVLAGVEVGLIGQTSHDEDTFYLTPGTYGLYTAAGTAYGTFTVAQAALGSFVVSSTTGALIATGNSIVIDPTKLAAIALNDLPDSTGRPEDAIIAGISTEFLNSHPYPYTFYLPIGTYTIANAAGIAYGTFTVADNGSGSFAVSGTTGALAANSNSINYEPCSLNSVTITPNAALGSWNLEGVTPSSGTDTVLLPDGTYTIDFFGDAADAGPATFSVGANGLSDTELPANSPLVSLKLSPCAPSLTSAAHVSNGTTITGSYMGRANTTYQLDFYADTTATSTGLGQGETLLGSTSVTTDSNGNATFTASVAAPPAGETLLSATATDPNGNVSAFSQVICLPANAQGTVYTVYTTADSGPDSLRQVILDANANATGTAANPDEIVFCIPTTDPGYNSTTGAFTIQPLSALPTITDTLVLDGYTQPGASPNTLTIGDNAVLNIVLDGSKVEAVDGLVIGGGNSTVRGLVIDHFASGSGIVLTDGSNDIVVGDFIGTDVTGGIAAANNVGIVTNPNGPALSIGERIGGTSPEDRNIISGNSNIGIDIDNGNVIEGNYIGTDKSGTTAVPNGTYNAGAGIFLGSNNTVGGTTAGAGNVISGNTSFGIHMVGNQNLVAGNLIGTTASGLAALDNGTGIYITGNSNTIGGSAAGARNIISGNEGPGSPSNVGINIDGQVGANTGQHNLVEGNYIGLDITGTKSLYQGAGIFITGAYNTIGGTTSGTRNIISGNGVGVFLFTSSYVGSPLDGFGNTILGNYIGTDASGTQPLGGQFGIYVTAGAYDNTIGGTTSGAGNIIAYHGGGVDIESGTGDSILGNSIFMNTLGISLNSANNANNNQAAPVLTGGRASSSETSVSGTLSSVANTTFRIEFFSNAGLDASGNAEGQTYLGFTTVTTESNGNAAFTATNLAAIPAGQGYVTATATNQSTGDTSEFSDYLTAPTSTVLTSSADPSSLNQPVTFTATVSSSFGTPTGSVEFVDTTTGTNLGTVALSSSGTASVTVSNLALGSHVITATYAGQGLFLGSSSTLTQEVSYGFNFLPPLSNGLTFALNRTIPIKFQLTDANGNPITSLSAVSSLQVAPVINGVPGTLFTPTSTNNQGLESVGNQYLYNWQTKGLSAGTYEIIVTLADGTTHTKTISLTAGGSSAGLVTDGFGGTATAGALLGGEVDLYVDNSNGDLSGDEPARIQDAIASIDAAIAPYGVVINTVSDPTQANVTLSMNATSSLGGVAQGVLGCTTDADQVTMIQGWNWYAGADATQIGSGQYDFETAVMHELGHVLGLGHSSNPASMMSATLAAGTIDRTLVATDLNVPDDDSGPCALHAASTVIVSSTNNIQDTKTPSSRSAPSSNSQSTMVSSSTSVTRSSGSSLSSTDQVFTDFARMLSASWNDYQSELSSVTALWQTADVLALQSLDAILSLEAGAMGVSKDTRMSDLLFASNSASSRV